MESVKHFKHCYCTLRSVYCTRKTLVNFMPHNQTCFNEERIYIVSDGVAVVRVAVMILMVQQALILYIFSLEISENVKTNMAT